MKTILYALLLIGMLCPFSLTAQLADPDVEDINAPTEAELIASYTAYTDSIEGTLTFYADTTVVIGDGMAYLDIPTGYRYVSPEDANTVLVGMWGNPPGTSDNSLGMLFPDKYPPSATDGYGIDIDFTEDGYIEDDDAADMDYDELLETLKKDTKTGNEYRREQGYETIELVGWAAPPRYDNANKRLHWAKELRFEGYDESTLNYNILFLGRRGYLTMNVIGGTKDLPEINRDLDDILGSIAYAEGHRYEDFDSSMDEVAAYGIGALIAGKVLAKTGLLAGLGLFLAKAWKLIALAGVAIVGVIRKLGGRGDS